MDYRQHGRVVSFIWNIADHVLRGSLNRTKYRDVIRRLDDLLEPRCRMLAADQGTIQSATCFCWWSNPIIPIDPSDHPKLT